MDRAFDDLMARPALWEPTILILREKGKRAREPGIDFFVKRQTNRLAESLRTVGQWIPYEGVPHPQPGQKVEIERIWARREAAAGSEAPDEESASA